MTASVAFGMIPMGRRARSSNSAIIYGLERADRFRKLGSDRGLWLCPQVVTDDLEPD
jgi:hypothetical protein